MTADAGHLPLKAGGRRAKRAGRGSQTRLAIPPRIATELGLARVRLVEPRKSQTCDLRGDPTLPFQGRVESNNDRPALVGREREAVPRKQIREKRSPFGLGGAGGSQRL